MNLILMAGLPASGKSSFASYASKELSIPVIAKDDIKEKLFDAIGFKSYSEKTKLDIAAANIMMFLASKMLEVGESVILDNNFEDRNIENLKAVIEKYPCNVITVRFDCDMKEAYRRYVLRDKDPSRHIGHVLMTCYPPVEGVVDAVKDMTEESFCEKYTRRGTMRFSMGKLICVDATDFKSVCYQQILQQLKAVLV